MQVGCPDRPGVLRPWGWTGRVRSLHRRGAAGRAGPLRWAPEDACALAGDGIAARGECGDVIGVALLARAARQGHRTIEASLMAPGGNSSLAAGGPVSGKHASPTRSGASRVSLSGGTAAADHAARTTRSWRSHCRHPQQTNNSVGGAGHDEQVTPTQHSDGIRAALPQDRESIIEVALLSGLFPPEGIADIEATLALFLAGKTDGDQWLTGLSPQPDERCGGLAPVAGDTGSMLPVIDPLWGGR